MENWHSPGAARASFAARIDAAIVQAGRPPLKTIVATSATIRGGVELKRSTVSAWRRGKGLPEGLNALRTLLLVLDKIAGVRGRFSDERDWERLYRAAQEEPPQAPRGETVTVRDFELWELGVHRARAGDLGSDFPAYIGRDIDVRVRAALGEAAATGGMILLSGDSTTGKTRMGYEALLAVLPDAQLLVPSGSLELADLIRSLPRTRLGPTGTPRVLWLDNLEKYLPPPGLDMNGLRALRRAGLVVFATMRLAFRQQHVESGTGLDILRSCVEFSVERLWSEAELARVREQLVIVPDSRLEDALGHVADHGIAEYLAAGPEIWRELAQASRVSGNPRGAALVQSAIGLALAGAPMPLRLDVLEQVHEIYLPGSNKALLAPESSEAAVRWATEVRYGVTAPLLPDGPGVRPFDYLVDATLRERGVGPSLVPDPIWRTALGLAVNAGDRFNIALAAYMNDLPSVSEDALLPLVDAGDLGAMRGLAEILRPSDPEAARGVLQRAVDLGDEVAMRLMGNHFVFQYKYDEADEWFRLAAEAGDEEAHAYFHKPGVYDQPEKGRSWYDREWDEEDDTPWSPTRRTLAVLLAQLEILGDMVNESVREAGDCPVEIDGEWYFVLDELPSQTWRMDGAWRRQFVRCFDDLADDIRGGRLPSPRCTGEEMALHLCLQYASSMTLDEPDFVAEITAGIPADEEDYDWRTCSDLLFEDHDVLFLYDPWLSSVADPRSSLHHQMGIAYLQPEEWFKPFRSENARDPERGHRR
ncbi:hypothetical protein ACFV6D_06080 [Kitasatospora sp. NPDC059812]|uniref:hypothetical protein n=1 Tax=unclassified Kitasatospora TaxID=2633591 RepID=UPI003668C554